LTALTNANFIDLKVELDISEVWNEVRVLLPSYSWTYELIGGVWVKIADDYSRRYTDGASMNKYGRRTKTFNKHVMDSGFGEEYCYAEVERLKEPCNKIEANLVGQDDANIALILGMDLSQQVSYVNLTSGLNDTGLIDNLVLDIDLDKIPRLAVNLTEVKSLDLLDWFIVDHSTVDGPDVIG
jgi:hypothetical protein